MPFRTISYSRSSKLDGEYQHQREQHQREQHQREQHQREQHQRDILTALARAQEAKRAAHIAARIAKESRSSPPANQNTHEDKYDNFYSPENKDFYSTIQYMRFKPEDRKIRLLRIHPSKDAGSMQSPVQQSPIEADLLDDQSLAAMSGNFTTLSYCAGNPRNTETIVVNGRKFNAFANLGHALRVARHFWRWNFGEKELLLWVDQVCINQSDVNERSHQVRFMGDIYKSAMQVLVCLSVEGSRRGGISWLNQFASQLDLGRLDGKIRCANGKWVQASKLLSKGFQNADYHDGWDIFLATIFNSPWWPRAWIRQEFLKSRDAYLLAGNECIHQNVLYDYLYVYDQGLRRIEWELNTSCPFSTRASPSTCLVCCHRSKLVIDRKLKARLDCAETLFSLRATATDTNRFEGYGELLDCMRHMYLFEASDPRDLVYSCFGISTCNYGILPNYATNFSFQDLLVQVAQSAIKHHRSFNMVLGWAQKTARARNPGLPSWVPYWGLDSSRSLTEPDDVHFNAFTDCFSFHPDRQGRPGRILRVVGVAVHENDSGWYIDSSNTCDHPAHDEATGERIETYLLQGTRVVHRFRRLDQYVELFGPRRRSPFEPPLDVEPMEHLRAQLDEMIENKHPDVVTLDIC